MAYCYAYLQQSTALKDIVCLGVRVDEVVHLYIHVDMDVCV